MPKRKEPEETLRCSFCHKHQDFVAKLVSSPSDYPRVYICDECITVCNSIIQDMNQAAAPPEPDAGWSFAEPVYVLLDPDIAQTFPDPASVNDALRQLLIIAGRLRNPASSSPALARKPNEP